MYKEQTGNRTSSLVVLGVDRLSFWLGSAAGQFRRSRLCHEHDKVKVLPRSCLGKTLSRSYEGRVEVISRSCQGHFRFNLI